VRKLRDKGKLMEVELSEEELGVINNALNEAREFVPPSEFHARMGVQVDVVNRLLAEVRGALPSAKGSAR
jgi:hypothetical protein